MFPEPSLTVSLSLDPHPGVTQRTVGVEGEGGDRFVVRLVFLEDTAS